MKYNSPRLKENNFDFLRLLFASTVCFVHAYDLSGFIELSWLVNVLSSDVAVKGFFVISGFLIFMSYERSKSLGSYTIKRIRRIYPAYFAIVMICAIGLVSVSTKSASDYFSFEWLKYVFANLTFLNFLQPDLPGVFESNIVRAVNGALWTLKIEVMFYMAVPLFVYLFRKFSVLPVLLLFYILSVVYSEIFSALAARTGLEIYDQLARQLPGQLSYFIAGGFFFYYLNIFERRIGYFVTVAVLILIINKFYPLPLLIPFSLAAAVIYFGLYLYIGNFGKYGDFSYGVYIIHFPTIQVLLTLKQFSNTPWYFLLAVVFITILGAIAMWHIVEKRFLLRNSHYITAAASPIKK